MKSLKLEFIGISAIALNYESSHEDMSRCENDEPYMSEGSYEALSMLNIRNPFPPM